MMSFIEFIHAYNDGSIEDDLAWRGNDIPGSVRTYDCKKALKRLGYQYAGEHALSMVRADYDIDSIPLAKQMLEYWWSYRRASDRKVARVKPRSAKSEPTGTPWTASDDPPEGMILQPRETRPARGKGPLR